MAYTTEFAAIEPSRTQVEQQAGITVLEFGTPWCGYCIAAQPLIEAALSGAEGIRHQKIEDGRGKPLGRSFQVKLWPTLVVLRDGIEVARSIRPTSRRDVEDVLRAAG